MRNINKFALILYEKYSLPIKYIKNVVFHFCKNVVQNPCYGDGAQLFSSDVSSTILSPQFPDSYPNHADCKWHIEGNQTNEIVLTFIEFDLEDG